MIRCLNVKVIYFQKNSFILLIIRCVHRHTHTHSFIHSATCTEYAEKSQKQRTKLIFLSLGSRCDGITHTFEINTLSINDKRFELVFKPAHKHKHASMQHQWQLNKQREIGFRVFDVRNYFPNRDEIWASLCFLLSISIFIVFAAIGIFRMEIRFWIPSIYLQSEIMWAAMHSHSLSE